MGKLTKKILVFGVRVREIVKNEPKSKEGTGGSGVRGAANPRDAAERACGRRLNENKSHQQHKGSKVKRVFNVQYSSKKNLEFNIFTRTIFIK